MPRNGTDEREQERGQERGQERISDSDRERERETGGQGQQAEAEKRPEVAERSRFAVDERIQVPDLDHDLTPEELALIMKRVAKVCNAIVANLLYTAATTDKPMLAGAGHPLTQSITNCAVHADQVYMALDAEIAKKVGLVLPGRDAAQKAAVPIRRQ